MHTIKSRFRAFTAKPQNDYILIGILVGLITVVNLVWIFTETRPPHWDMGRHLWTSLQYLDLFKRGKPYGLLANYYYYPPVLYLVALPFYLLFGVSVPSAVLSNTLFVSIAAFSMYGIGKQLWGRRVGLVSTLFLLCSPMMVTQFKEFQIDAPLTAMVSLSLYLLIRSREFISTKLSLLLGLSIGLGLLTKWTYGFIMAVPIGLAVLLALVLAYKEKTWLRLGNMVACFVMAYCVASVWYITNLHQIMIDLTQNGVGAGAREGDPIVGSFASNIWYGWNLVSNQLYLIPCLFLAVGIVYLFVNKTNARKNRYPIVLVLGTFLLFTLLRNKDARYTLPALSGISILATYWISQLKRRRTMQVVAVGLAIYLAAMFYAISFGSRLLPGQVTLVKGTYPIVGFAQKGYIIGPATHENWQLAEVFEKARTLPAKQRTLYYSGPDTIWFNSWDMAYYAKRSNTSLVGDETKATIVIIRFEPGQTIVNPHNYKVLPLPDGGTLIYGEKH